MNIIVKDCQSCPFAHYDTDRSGVRWYYCFISKSDLADIKRWRGRVPAWCKLSGNDVVISK